MADEILLFIDAKDPKTLDDLLSRGVAINADVRYFNIKNALYESCCFDDRADNVLYLLTCHPPAQINVNVNSQSPLHKAASTFETRPDVLKFLIDFGADRDKKDNMGRTALDVANSYQNKCAKGVLLNYFPTEMERMLSQLECKKKVDVLFSLPPSLGRHKQSEIDLRFQSIPAVISGDIDLLYRSIDFVDKEMSTTLLLIALEIEQLQTLPCLCWKIRGDSKIKLPDLDPSSFHDNLFYTELVKTANNSSSVKERLIEILFFIGLSPTDLDSSFRHFDILLKSQVLCLVKILFHKFVYLDSHNTYLLIQTLLLDFQLFTQ